MITYTYEHGHAKCECGWRLLLEPIAMQSHAHDHHNSNDWQYLSSTEACSHDCACGMPCERYAGHSERGVEAHQCHFCYELAIAACDSNNFYALEVAA